MPMTTGNFGKQLDKRMDIVSEDLPRNTSGDLEEALDPSGPDSSGDVKTADGIKDGNATVPFGGSAVTAPKVATATSKSAVVQHSASASKVKP